MEFKLTYTISFDYAIGEGGTPYIKTTVTALGVEDMRGRLTTYLSNIIACNILLDMIKSNPKPAEFPLPEKFLAPILREMCQFLMIAMNSDPDCIEQILKIEERNG